MSAPFDPGGTEKNSHDVCEARSSSERLDSCEAVGGSADVQPPRMATQKNTKVVEVLMTKPKRTACAALESILGGHTTAFAALMTGSVSLNDPRAGELRSTAA
jgi:hypothetical protein